MRSTKLYRILVTTDFSPGTTDALHYACALATDRHASITLLHVLEETRALTSAKYRKEVSEEAEKKMRSLVVKTVGDQCAVQTRVEAGSADYMILRTARDEKADVLVMNTHGKGMIERVLMGSTTARVVREAPCPVMLVRSKLPKRTTRDKKRAA